MGHRWAQWAGDDLLFSLGVTPVCKCGIRTPWENERLPAAASKRNRNVKTLWCCDVRIWNVGSDRLMVLISFGWIREQCHLAYIMTEEWSQQLTTVQRRATAVTQPVLAASYWQFSWKPGKIMKKRASAVDGQEFGTLVMKSCQLVGCKEKGILEHTP